METFSCLVADPAWKFDDKLSKKRGAERNYRCMSLDDICRLELPPLADDAYLFLWRVASMVPEAYLVVKVWGFVPKTEIVWIKKTKRGNRHFGMGRHLRAEHEVAIVATRGKPKRLLANVRSTFEATVGRHSEKPEEFFRIVESFAPGPRAELFARQHRPHWTCMGDEIGRPMKLAPWPVVKMRHQLYSMMEKQKAA